MAKKFGINNKLSTALSETLISADEFKGKLRLEGIRLSKVNLDPRNPRDLLISREDVVNGIDPKDPDYNKKNEELETLKSLAHSILQNGLINPIVVFEESGEFILVAGERRTLASIIAKKDRIPARILSSKPSEQELPLLQWVENIEREDLNLRDKIRNLERIFDVNARNAKNIEALLGCGTTMAHNYSKLLQPMNNTLKKLIDTGQINSIKKALLLLKLDEHEIRDYLYRSQDASESEQPKFSLKALDSEVDVKSKKTKSGAKKKNISLGETKRIAVARKLFNAFKRDDSLKRETDLVPEPDWTDIKEINKAFSDLIFFLEEGCSE